MTTKQLRAYIAASAETDTAFIRRLLSDADVQVDDAYSLDAGELLSRGILDRLRVADFAVAVISESVWTVYEVGICDALGKPVLVLAAPGIEIPPVIAWHQHLRTQLVDTSLLRLTLQKFIDEVRSGARRLSSRSSRRSGKALGLSSTRQLQTAIAQARQQAQEKTVEELAKALLEASASTVVAQQDVRGDRVDFAVWDEMLSNVAGNPLVVEVKSGNITPERLEQAEHIVAKAMAAANARLGLVLYLDRQGRRFPQKKWDTPFVIRFDLEDLAEALQERSFANIVVEQRNRLVHGVG